MTHTQGFIFSGQTTLEGFIHKFKYIMNFRGGVGEGDHQNQENKTFFFVRHDVIPYKDTLHRYRLINKRAMQSILLA